MFGKRTSMRLHNETWESLKEIAHREKKSIGEICEAISPHVREAEGLTAMVRVFVLCYFRDAATEEGHRARHHGEGGNLERLMACL